MRKFKPQKLAGDVIREAKRLLDIGCTKSYVQRKLSLGRGSVNRIADGKLQADGEDSPRCGGCGGLQELPCLVCEARSLIAA